MTPDANKSIEIPLRSGELDWEPLSLKAACPKEAKTEDIEENWAICAGYGVLKNEMYRYCCGLIRGQSFLVAGHRGAGKTLLTHLAVQVNRWRAEGKISERPGNQTSALAVPILVSLHGPDLLNSTVDYAREKEGALATHSMEQILLGLQRAYKEEILLRFRSAFPGADSAADLAELTRELQSVSAGSSALRYWERFGVMSQGILGRTLGEASKLGQIANGSQGYAEVNLLESLNHCTETLEAGDNSTVQMATSGGSHVQIDLRRLRSYWRIIVPILSLVAAIFAVSKIPSGSTALASWLLPVAVFFFMIAATRRILFRGIQGL